MNNKVQASAAVYKKKTPVSFIHLIYYFLKIKIWDFHYHP